MEKPSRKYKKKAKTIDKKNKTKKPNDSFANFEKGLMRSEHTSTPNMSINNELNINDVDSTQNEDSFSINIEEARRLTDIKRKEEDFLSVIRDIGSRTVICSDQVPNLNDKRLKKLPFNKIDENGSSYVRMKVNSDENIVSSNREFNREFNREINQEINQEMNQENLNKDDKKIEDVENFNDGEKILEIEIQDKNYSSTVKVEVESNEEGLKNESKVTLEKDTLNRDENNIKYTQETIKTLSISEKRELKKEKKRFNETAANDSFRIINTTDPMTKINDIVIDTISANKSENVESGNFNSLDPKSQRTNDQSSEDIIPNSQLSNTLEQNKNQFLYSSILFTSQDSILDQENEICPKTKNTYEKTKIQRLKDQNQSLKEIENLDNAITNQIENEFINFSSQLMEPDAGLSLILPETNVEECTRNVDIELSDSFIGQSGQNISELNTTINSEQSTRINIDRVKKLVDKNESNSRKVSQRSTVAEKQPKELPEKFSEILNGKTDFSNESISSTSKKKHKKGDKEKLKDLVRKTVEDVLEKKLGNERKLGNKRKLRNKQKLGNKRKLKSKKSKDKPSKRFKRIVLSKDSSESSSDDCDDNNTERILNEDGDSEDNSKRSSCNKELKQRKINEMIEKQLNRIINTENELLDNNEKLSNKHSDQSEKEENVRNTKRRKSSSSSKQYCPEKRKKCILDCLNKIQNTILHKSHKENSSRRNEDDENSESSEFDVNEISNEYVDAMREARFHLIALSSPNQAIRNLKVKIDFEVPKLHQIATKLVSNPTKAQYMNLMKERIKIKTEHFSEKEDFLIYSNYGRFCEVHNLDDDPLPFLNIGADCLIPQSQKLKFVQYLGKGLEDRTLHSIHLRFQKLMSTRKLEGFTPEEDEIILNYQNDLRRSKNILIALEFILRRSRKLILKRFDELM